MKPLALVQLVLALILHTGLGHADQQSDLYKNFRDGVPASISQDDYLAKRQTVIHSFQNLRNQVIQQSLPILKKDSKCREFSQSTMKFLSHLSSTLDLITTNEPLNRISSNEEFLARIRFNILMSMFMPLRSLLQDGLEKDQIDITGVPERCTYPDRAALLKGFDSTARDLFTFHRLAFGVPGLLTLDQATDRLLGLAHTDEIFRSRLNWAVAVGTIAVSFIPIGGASSMVAFASREFLGNAPKFLASKTMRYIVSPAVGTMAFIAVDHLIEPEQDQRSAADQMTRRAELLAMINMLCNTPLDYAQVDLATINMAKIELSRVYQDLLGQSAALRSRFSDFNLVSAINEEASVLGKGSVEEQLEIMKERLNHLGLEVQCDNRSFTFRDITNVDCLTGLRKLARIMYLKHINLSKLATAQVMKIVLTDSPSGTTFGDHDFDLWLNPSSTVEELLAKLRTALTGSLTESLAHQMVNIEEMRQDFRLNSKLEISIDPSLNNFEQMSGMYMLLGFIEQNKGLADSDAEEIYLTHENRSLEEHYGVLRLSLGARSSAENIAKFLESDKLRPDHAEVVAQVSRQRAEEAKLIANLEKDHGLDAGCTEKVGLTECVDTLTRVKTVLEKYPATKLDSDVKRLRVVSRERFPQASRVYRSYSDDSTPTTWAVRDDMPYFAFKPFLQNEGWLP